MLHLNEHYGNGSPRIFVRMAVKGLAAYHGELQTKTYWHTRPDVKEEQSPSTIEIAVINLFRNCINY